MNKEVVIYHNDQCAKSREVLDYLRQRGIEPRIVDYIATPPSVDELRQLTKMLGVAPSSLIRPNDFERLGLVPTADAERLLEMIASHPAILHRPIVVVGDRARVARPASLVDELIEGLAS